MNSRYAYFGLLTYAQTDQTLNKRDVQLFLKRLRIKGHKFKYLIAGEHGDKRDRPHWHCLFFTNEPIPFLDIASAWRGGYERADTMNRAGWVNFSNLKTDRGLRYTVKYLYKYDGVDPRFVLMISKNPAIGIQYLSRQIWHLEKKTLDFTVEGRPTAMPRYYKRKIFDGYEDIKEEVNSKLADKVAQMEVAVDLQLQRQNPELNHYQIINLKKQLYEQRNEYERNKERNQERTGKRNGRYI